MQVLNCKKVVMSDCELLFFDLVLCNESVKPVHKLVIKINGSLNPHLLITSDCKDHG